MSIYFPKTRYQGSKYKLKDFIKDKLKDLSFETSLDAFSGTSTISHILKSMGKTTYSNDILKFNYYVSKALIENNQEQIIEKDIKEVLTKKENFIYKDFIEKTFEDIYFLKEENVWLDIVIQNINLIENEYKKAMLLWALYQSCLSKRPYNLFHRKNLHLRTNEVKRNFGNKTTWDKSFEEHFLFFIKEINKAIFNNKKDNKSYSKDILELDLKADLVYLDPPYIPKNGSLIYYRDFYHFLEGLSDYDNWEKKLDLNSKNKKMIHNYNIWEDKKNIINGFEQIIEKFKDSIFVISYRDDGIPEIKDIVSILEKYNKKVKIEKIDYRYVLSNKKDLKEVLIIAE